MLRAAAAAAADDDDDDDDVHSHQQHVNVAVHAGREPFRYFLKSVTSPPYIRHCDVSLRVTMTSLSPARRTYDSPSQVIWSRCRAACCTSE